LQQLRSGKWISIVDVKHSTLEEKNAYITLTYWRHLSQSSQVTIVTSSLSNDDVIIIIIIFIESWQNATQSQRRVFIHHGFYKIITEKSVTFLDKLSVVVLWSKVIVGY